MFSQTVSYIEGFNSDLRRNINVSSEYDPELAMPDPSLVMTMAILMHNRVPDFKLFSKKIEPHEIDTIENIPTAYQFYWIIGDCQNPDTALDPIKNRFIKIEKAKFAPVEIYCQKELGYPIYYRVMPEENIVCIFLQTMTFRAFHAAQFFISLFFPSVFKEHPLTKEETDFLLTLTQKNGGNYIEKLKEQVNTPSFRRFALTMNLCGMERKLFERKINIAKDQLRNIEAEIDAALSKYQMACSKRTEALALVYGLEHMQNQHEIHTELQDYLINNKSLVNISLDDKYLSFIAKTELIPHHADEWEYLSNNPDWIKQFRQAPFSSNDVKLLLDAIFSEDRCLKLKMCAYFELDYFGSRVTSKKGYDYVSASPELKDYCPNPHLNIYNCFGQNATVILEQLKNGDTIGAIECCLSCAGKVNIHEDLTFKPFIQNVLSFTGKCLLTEEGKSLTPIEAVEYLKERNHE